jgi:hypothetical protein
MFEHLPRNKLGRISEISSSGGDVAVREKRGTGVVIKVATSGGEAVPVIGTRNSAGVHQALYS